MRYGKIGLGYYDDLFGLNDLYINFGGYSDPAQSMPLAQGPNSPASPPVSYGEKAYFGYSFPVFQVSHHYDVNYFSSDYWQNGQVSGGNYNFSNFSVDTVDLYSWFGHTSMYHITSSSGYGSWTAAPGYYSSNGQYWSSESAGVHSQNWFGSTDSFAFRNTSGQYSHIELGELMFDTSHQETHEGAGVHVNTILASMDGFVFRDTVIDTSHFQVGDYVSDSQHVEVRGGSSQVYDDLFGNHGRGETASISVHDQWSQSDGRGRYESHTNDYSSHTTDTMTIGIEPYMVSGLQIDDMSILLGLGGGGKG